MAEGETISITLTLDSFREVNESVKAGEYASTSDVMQEAVRLWQRQRQEDAERLDAIRARIRRSLDDPRPALTIDEVRARIDALHAETVTAHRHEAT